MPHSEKSLFQLLLFRIALLAPIIVAVLVAIYIIFTSDLTFESGFSGLNNAFNIFKIPLGIFSLVFPSVALVTANHRSIQSKKQISLAQQNIELSIKQNTLKNYYDSIDDFEKYLESFTSKTLFIYKNKRVFYRKIFPSNTHKFTSTSIDIKILNEIKENYKIFMEDVLKDMIEHAECMQNNNIGTLDAVKAVATIYSKLRSHLLIHFGIGLDETRYNNESVMITISNISDEFYSLLSYSAEYNHIEKRLLNLRPNELITSKTWLELLRKVQLYSTVNLNIIDFKSINIPPEK